MAENYCGNREAFLYVYLSAADEAAGCALVDALSGAGHRLYVSSSFTAKDARVLQKAAAAVLMMSSATLGELSPVVTAATRTDKPLIPVYLDKFELPAGMRMLLGPKQAHSRENFSDGADFAEALPRSPVLQNLKVTPAQKRAARGLLSGVLAAAAVIIAGVLLLTLRHEEPAVPQITGETLTGLGLSGDPAGIETVCLYGTALHDGFEAYGAQNLETRTDSGAVGVYLPGEDATVGRGVLTDAADFAQLVNLKELALSGNAFEDLTPLWTLTQLQRLDLSCNLGAVSLEGISALQELEYLNVAYCKLSGGLEELQELPKLQTLVISSEHLAAVAPLSARGVSVCCPSVTADTWEELKAASEAPWVYDLCFRGEDFRVPKGETLTVRENVHFGSELGSTLNNYGTVELFGSWETGMTGKNNYGTVIVRDGGLYSGGMGDSHNNGDFTVDAGGTLEIDRGEQFYLEGGTLTVNGTLRIGGGGALLWEGGAIVNNGTIETNAPENVLDEMLSGRLADVEGVGTLITGPEDTEEAPAAAPVALDAFADLPNDPTDADSLDEYGMTPRERAYFDTVDYRYPTLGGAGTEKRPLTPYVDAESLMVKPPIGCEYYLARDMTVPHQPPSFDGFADLFIGRGATVTLCGDDWTTGLAISILPGATLIVDGDVMFEMAYNAGTLIVNGRLRGEAPSYGITWGMFGNSGTVTVNGAFEPGQFYRFAGGEEEGEIDVPEIVDLTDMEAPLQFANGYRSMSEFAIAYSEQNEKNMWWNE